MENALGISYTGGMSTPDYYDAYGPADQRDDDVPSLNVRPYRISALAGLVMYLAAIMLPSRFALFGIELAHLAAAIGTYALVVPTLMVARYQQKTRKHFSVVLHLVVPILGLTMFTAQLVLLFMPLPTAFTNIWGILSTLLMFPLFQQLMDLATGNIDVEDGGKQLHFQ